MDATTDHLITGGGASSYEEYQRLVGKIEAYQIEEEILNN